MEFTELRNESDNVFTDITSEEERIYHFENGEELVIPNPVALSVSVSGGHRVLDGEGRSYYVRPVFSYIEWKAKEGQPHFVK